MEQQVSIDRAQAREQCLKKLSWATQQLQTDIAPPQLAAIADLIVQPMTGPWRYFHTPHHIFEVGGAESAIEVLAALFHDVVYVQVDRSINFNLSYYIAPFSKEAEGQLQIRDRDELSADESFDLVTAAFGFAPGQTLNPFAGQNEFLSAVVAVKALEPFLAPQYLLEIAACIEATIPFRRATEDGKTASDLLYARLQKASLKLAKPSSDEALLETVKKAVRVANRDVISFAHESSAHFLDNTWNLLPETNHNLISTSSYTVRQYRVALQKMEGFMGFLDPDTVFRQFQGEPDDETYNRWQATARRNIEVARLYLGCKLFAIALLEALSLRLGEEIPLATLVGELPAGQASETFHLEDLLPDIPKPIRPKTALEWEVFNLLEEGRATNSAYDLKHSPLATFIVQLLGFEGVKYQCNRAKELFKGDCSPEAFLAGCDPRIIEVIVESTVALFESRKSALKGYFSSSSNQFASDAIV
ncbi:MAG: hypothetical protein SW833_25725 [Cyanobacteriota bacterium]|nr:hypothetical protein [Cyanobacteriota bacterium]